MPGRHVARTWHHDPTKDVPEAYRSACEYAAFIPDELSSLALPLDAELAGMVAEAEQLIRQLNDEGGSALDPLARLLLRTESISSTKARKIRIGVHELARAEAHAESGIAPSQAALELLATIDAMVDAIGDGVRVEPFSVAEILAVHRRLLALSSQKEHAGNVRDLQNWVGGNEHNPCGADYVPPPPEELDRLLANLCAAINDETHPPLVQAALVHAQLEAIHPFDDGNGRIGRALVHVVLRRRGIAPRFVPPMSVVLSGARNRYIAALMRFRADAIEDWVAHFTVATIKAARLSQTYLEAVRALQERWRQQLRAAGEAPPADATALAIIDILPAHPMISVDVAAAVTSGAKDTAQKGIDQLVTAGVLLPLSEGSQNRRWETVGLLDLIAQLEMIAQLEAGLLPQRSH
jgi:Fic family protein